MNANTLKKVLTVAGIVIAVAAGMVDDKKQEAIIDAKIDEKLNERENEAE